MMLIIFLCGIWNLSYVYTTNPGTGPDENPFWWLNLVVGIWCCGVGLGNILVPKDRW